MPYTQREPRRDINPEHDKFVHSLVQEIGRGKKGTGPIIIEEAVHASKRLHVYVIWDQWEGVREEHRSAAILDAYRQAPDLGEEVVRRVSVAMGLTPDEAKALGIRP